MKFQMIQQRSGWILLGIFAGVAVAYMWSSQPAQAITNSRAEKFEMFTCPAATLGNEGVFVLDHITGSLRGSVLDPQTASFNVFYYRNVAQDFEVAELGGKPQYAVLSGRIQLQNRPGVRVQTAPGVIYIAELTTGRVNAYAFSWQRTTGKDAIQELIPVDRFNFREADIQ